MKFQVLLCSVAVVCVTGCTLRSSPIGQRSDTEQTAAHTERFASFSLGSKNSAIEHLSLLSYPDTSRGGIYGLHAASFSREGMLYVLTHHSQKEITISQMLANGKLKPSFRLRAPEQTEFDRPTLRFAISDDGKEIWVTSYNTNPAFFFGSDKVSWMYVLHYNSFGQLLNRINLSKTPNLKQAMYMTVSLFVDKNSNLYLASDGTNTIIKLRPTGQSVAKIEASDSFFVSREGEIISVYPASKEKTAIEWIDEKNKVMKKLQVSIPSYDSIELVGVDDAHNIYLWCWKRSGKELSFNSQLYYVTLNGNVTKLADVTDNSGLFQGKYKFYGGAIPRFTKDGVPQEPVLGQAIFVDDKGKVYFETASSTSYEIWRIGQ